MKTYKITFRTGEKNYLGIDIMLTTFVTAENREKARQIFEHKVFVSSGKAMRYSRTSISTMVIEK